MFSHVLPDIALVFLIHIITILWKRINNTNYFEAVYFEHRKINKYQSLRESSEKFYRNEMKNLS